MPLLYTTPHAGWCFSCRPCGLGAELSALLSAESKAVVVFLFFFCNAIRLRVSRPIQATTLSHTPRPQPATPHPQHGSSSRCVPRSSGEIQLSHGDPNVSLIPVLPFFSGSSFFILFFILFLRLNMISAPVQLLVPVHVRCAQFLGLKGLC